MQGLRSVVFSKTPRRIVCGRSRCRHEFQRHPEQFFGLRYPSAPLGHNASRNPIKPGLKIGTEPGRGWRHVAGPELPEINYRVPPDVPASKANKTFQEYWQKAKRRTARKALFKRATPPLNLLGGYRFPGAPQVDLGPTRATPRTPVGPPIGDGLEIPAFLRRHQPSHQEPEPNQGEPSC
jgi:hypothetical protein